MSPNTMHTYRRAQDIFDAVLGAVPADRWEAPSACAEWTVRDVAGHVIWGQEQLAHWATGRNYGRREGAPGAPQPGVMAGEDPVATWRAVRTEADAMLTDETLRRTVTLPALGQKPAPAIVTLLTTDLLAHTWDIGHALDIDVRLDADLIPGAFAWARDNIVRLPGFFGPELSASPGADEQTRWLAYLGRDSRMRSAT